MNTSKFDNKGAVYAKARPGYPAALFSYLRENGNLCKDTVVADVGAGTGIFTAQLASFAKNRLRRGTQRGYAAGGRSAIC